MSTYLAARCPECSKWISVRECDGDAPTFDPTFMMQLGCSHCGKQSKLPATALELVPESDLH
jgi:C4-type Zn-finger protein